MPVYFDTMSCAEYHCVPLLELLIKHHAKIHSLDVENVRNKVYTEPNFKRHLVLQNLYIVTTYFDARTINYYASIMKEVF